MCNSAKMILKSTFFDIKTLTSNNSKNIRARKKGAEIICSPAFSLFNDVICSSLFSTDTAARGRKDERKILSRLTMTSCNFETRSYFKKRAT